jgi:D-3-phosphoglycerate dehydrogenase
MRRDAILVNTARGPIVDESALHTALSEGWISGAGLDVLESEPPRPSSPLLSLDNVLVTPHIAAYSDDFWPDSWRQSVEAIIDLSKGRWPRFCANWGVVPRRPLAPEGNGRPPSAPELTTRPAADTRPSL